MKHSLAHRQAIISQVGIPERCVCCDQRVKPPQVVTVMIINAQGEAAVCDQLAWFCAHCPALYFEEASLNQVAELFAYNPYAVVGLIDYQQLPADKRHVPLGEDPDLPIPLLEFTSVQPLQAGRLQL